nr:MAG TPA: hypothetical protein [Caudoviricetes sp.]
MKRNLKILALLAIGIVIGRVVEIEIEKQD